MRLRLNPGSGAPSPSSWFGFFHDGVRVGWQQLVRRTVQGRAPNAQPLRRREVLTAFRIGEAVQVSAFFAEAPEGEPLAWSRFGTLVPGAADRANDGDAASYVEGTSFERRGDELLLPGGDTRALPPVCYPGQLLLELAMERLRSGSPELVGTPLNDADGSLQPVTRLRLAPSLLGPPGVTHRFDEAPIDGSPGQRSILLAPDGRPVRQVWGPGTWSGPGLTREQAQASGPSTPSLALPD
ncbi:MAG: hypothetical protein P1V81_17105 [Planctomycetota bacterium]|nr:hypothetical protein [Planctomycetota bacterium]